MAVPTLTPTELVLCRKFAARMDWLGLGAAKVMRRIQVPSGVTAMTYQSYISALRSAKPTTKMTDAKAAVFAPALLTTSKELMNPRPWTEADDELLPDVRQLIELLRTHEEMPDAMAAKISDGAGEKGVLVEEINQHVAGESIGLSADLKKRLTEAYQLAPDYFSTGNEETSKPKDPPHPKVEGAKADQKNDVTVESVPEDVLNLGPLSFDNAQVVRMKERFYVRLPDEVVLQLLWRQARKDMAQ